MPAPQMISPLKTARKGTGGRFIFPSYFHHDYSNGRRRAANYNATYISSTPLAPSLFDIFLAPSRFNSFRLSRFAVQARVFNTLKSEINGIILIRRPNGLSVQFSLYEPVENVALHPARRPPPAARSQKSGARASQRVRRGRRDRTDRRRRDVAFFDGQ